MKNENKKMTWFEKQHDRGERFFEFCELLGDRFIENLFKTFPDEPLKHTKEGNHFYEKVHTQKVKL